MTIQVISKATYFPNRTVSESNPTVFFLAFTSNVPGERQR